MESPNQEFTFQSRRYNFTVKLQTVHGMTLFSLLADGERICTSVRCFPNSIISIPTRVDLGGFFFWTCPFDDYPYFARFDQQALYFFEFDEADNV